MTHQSVTFNELPLVFNHSNLTFLGYLPDDTGPGTGVGWGDDEWGVDWWGSMFGGLAPDEQISHISTTRDRPRVAPRARF